MRGYIKTGKNIKRSKFDLLQITLSIFNNKLRTYEVIIL